METIAAEVSRDIYPMPAFVTLVVPDVDRAVDWYVNGLDFVVLFTMPGPGGQAALVHLRRWRYQDILVRPGDAVPSGACTPSVMADAGQLAALASRAREHGDGAVEGPFDTPWNTRDLIATDPFGNRLVLTSRRPDGEQDERFDRRIVELAREQGLS
jgi:catechol 2,3-dioxygenase-like lactoylglutathione lyase family enzyme